MSIFGSRGGVWLMRVAWALVICVSTTSAIRAQGVGWTPTKVVKIIIPTAGGTNDIFVRIVAPRLSAALGTPVIAEPKPGAGGIIATEYVAKSAPDGYTLLLGSSGPLAVNATLYDKLPYDPLTDLAPISYGFDAPQFLVINPSIPASNLPEFIQYAKAQPGKLSYASVGFGAGGHLLMELFKSDAQIDMVHVPYRGAAPAVADLLSGHVQAAFSVAGNVQEQVKSGLLKALGLAGEQRLASAPDVLTMKELGFTNIDSGAAWAGIMAPGGTPGPIIDRYNRELVQILALPEVKSQFARIGMSVKSSTPAEFGEYIKSEKSRWATIIKKLGLPVQPQ